MSEKKQISKDSHENPPISPQMMRNILVALFLLMLVVVVVLVASSSRHGNSSVLLVACSVVGTSALNSLGFPLDVSGAVAGVATAAAGWGGEALQKKDLKKDPKDKDPPSIQ